MRRLHRQLKKQRKQMNTPAVTTVVEVSLSAVTVMTKLPLTAFKDASEVDRAVASALQFKEKVVSECLQRVEEAVDAFLAHFYGFDHDAIPFDYLDKPPASLNVVEDNLGILMHCLTEMFAPSSAIRTNMIDLRRALYAELLHPLRRTLEELCSQIHCGGSGSSNRVYGSQSPQQQHQGGRARIEAEVRHLAKMEALEDTFLDEKFKSCGLSDVVPISGLYASRIHRLENEARTVLSHWKRR